MPKKNKKIEFHKIEIKDAGAKGKCVAIAPDGKIIFINNVVPGDVVDVQTFKKRKKFYEARVTNIHRFSDHRIEPSCEYFGSCGGCKWQNMEYSKQLFYKEKEVKNNLEKIGKIKVNELLPIKGAKKKFFYRNKKQSNLDKFLTLNGNNHYNLDYHREKITFIRTPNYKFKRFSKFKNDHLINYNFYKNFWSSI